MNRDHDPSASAASLYSPHWNYYLKGTGALDATGSSLRLVLDPTSQDTYSDAQLDDYQGLSRRRFPWQPPVEFTIRARFSHPTGALQGTAGFGFWNDPFLMTGARWPVLPRALWFFYASPPSNMKLERHTPGWGWKTAVIDAARPSALLLAPLALPAVLLMNARPLYRALWPPIQRALQIKETALSVDMTAWHTYRLHWGAERSSFYVDSTGGTDLILEAPSPGGPLGFVLWLDNQYMIVTPQGRLRWGLLATAQRQWIEVDRLEISVPTQPPA